MQKQWAGRLGDLRAGLSDGTDSQHLPNDFVHEQQECCYADFYYTSASGLQRP